MTEVARRLSEAKQAQSIMRELSQDYSQLDQMGLARLLRAVDTLNEHVAWFTAYIAAEMAIEKAAKAKTA